MGTIGEGQAAANANATGGMALRGAGLLIVRQGLVSLATVAGVLTLSALLSPGDFALYGYATTVMLLGAAVGDLGLGASLIRREEPTDEQLRGSFALQLAFWLPICVLGTAAGAALAVYGFSTATTALLFGALLLISLQALPTALLERRMRFGAITAVESSQRIVFVAVAISLAAASPAQWSTPLAALAAGAVSYPAVLAISRWHWWPKLHRGEPLFRGFSSHWWQSRIANQLTYATYPLLGGLLFTSREVGLMVWALAVTSIPALMAPMVARAAFPAMARTAPEDQVAVFRPLFKGLLLVGLPMVAAIFTCAEPLTAYVLGSKWLDGVVLLRLESATTLLGIVLTVVAPLLFLMMPARRVKWIMVSWTAAVVVLGAALAPLAGFRSISIAQIVVASVVLFVVVRAVSEHRSYRILSDMRPGLVGLVVAVAIGIPLAGAAGSAAGALAAAAAVAVVQLAVTVALGGGADPRMILRRARPAAPADDLGSAAAVGEEQLRP
ncbi:MAG TPA: oligosaccharide flippase family protein [Solirubrobacterales bacterium]|nr:oligosaccharide flippase family protein [Solirubrobacterales bacterium]